MHSKDSTFRHSFHCVRWLAKVIKRVGPKAEQLAGHEGRRRLFDRTASKSGAAGCTVKAPRDLHCVRAMGILAGRGHVTMRGYVSYDRRVSERRSYVLSEQPMRHLALRGETL